MNKSEIIAAYEDFDRIHLSFSQQLDQFKANMTRESDDVLKTVDTLGKYWKKNGYDAFKKNMQGSVNHIFASLERCDNLSQILKQTSAEIREELRVLQEK